MIGISLVKSVPYYKIAALRINIFQLYGCQIVNLFQAKVLTKYFIYKNNYYLFNIYFSNFLPCCLFKGCCESCHYFLSQLDTTRHAKKVCKYNLQKHLFMSGCLYVSFHTQLKIIFLFHFSFLKYFNSSLSFIEDRSQ